MGMRWGKRDPISRQRRGQASSIGCAAAIAWLVVLLVTVAVPVTAGGWQRALATWYGPGLYYGNGMACGGGQLTPSTWGVAHLTLPCGTSVTFRHGGRTATARVIDRTGRGHPGFDLTVPVCRALAHCWTGTIVYQVGGVGDGPAPTAGRRPAPPLRAAGTLPPTDAEAP